MAIWVKICGITRLQDARAAFENGADAIGLNFWPSSKRYCEPRRASDIVAALGVGALVFGVFVRASRQEITDIVAEVGLTGVQMHGGETPEAAEGWSVPVIRAISATTTQLVASELTAAQERAGRVPSSVSAQPLFGTSRLLLDHASGGGSGKTIGPGVLEGLDLRQSILAGGLTPQNIAATVARLRPYGVDTAGGVESAPGIKDARAMEAFVRAARS